MTISAAEKPIVSNFRFWSRPTFNWRQSSSTTQTMPGDRFYGVRNLRLPGSKQTVLASLAAFVTLLTLILITTAQRRHGAIFPYHKDLTTDGPSTCKSSITFQCESCLLQADVAYAANVTEANDPSIWKFDSARDFNKLDLDADQCEAAFPGLFEDMERAARIFRQRGLTITEKNLTDNTAHVGTVRAMVYDQQLFVIEANDVNRFWFQSRALATLSSINRAVMMSKTPLPNVEFTFTILDSTDDEFWEGRPNQPIMAYTRKAEYSHVWLMPDFGGWSYPETHLGTPREVMQKMDEVETIWPWEEKVPRIVWRGVEWTAPTLRGNLVEASIDKDWADIKAIKWDDKDSMKADYLPIEEHCRYMFLAYTEGRSYSGRLRYLQNCHSVIFSHKMQWITPTSYLLVSEGPKQNYVQVERDFSDLEEKVEDLLMNPLKARLVADNSRKTFRNRYLSPAADACYWRRLLKTWRSLSFEPDFYVKEAPEEATDDKTGKPKKPKDREQKHKVRDDNTGKRDAAKDKDPISKEKAKGNTDKVAADKDAVNTTMPMRTVKMREWRGVPFETYALMRNTRW